MTAPVREALLEALDRKGGAAYFERLADEHPQAFAALVGKLIPSEIRAEVETARENILIVRDYTRLPTEGDRLASE